MPSSALNCLKCTLYSMAVCINATRPYKYKIVRVLLFTGVIFVKLFMQTT